MLNHAVLRVAVEGRGYIGFVEITPDTTLAQVRTHIQACMDADTVPPHYQFAQQKHGGHELSRSGGTEDVGGYYLVGTRKESSLQARTFLPTVTLVPTPESPLAEKVTVRLWSGAVFFMWCVRSTLLGDVRAEASRFWHLNPADTVLMDATSCVWPDAVTVHEALGEASSKGVRVCVDAREGEDEDDAAAVFQLRMRNAQAQREIDPTGFRTQAGSGVRKGESFSQGTRRTSSHTHMRKPSRRTSSSKAEPQRAARLSDASTPTVARVVEGGMEDLLGWDDDHAPLAFVDEFEEDGDATEVSEDVGGDMAHTPSLRHVPQSGVTNGDGGGRARSHRMLRQPSARTVLEPGLSSPGAGRLHRAPSWTPSLDVQQLHELGDFPVLEHRLWRAFTYYAAAGDSGDPFHLRARQWRCLLDDCGILKSPTSATRATGETPRAALGTSPAATAHDVALTPEVAELVFSMALADGRRVDRHEFLIHTGASMSARKLDMATAAALQAHQAKRKGASAHTSAVGMDYLQFLRALMAIAVRRFTLANASAAARAPVGAQSLTLPPLPVDRSLVSVGSHAAAVETVYFLLSNAPEFAPLFASPSSGPGNVSQPVSPAVLVERARMLSPTSSAEAPLSVSGRVLHQSAARVFCDMIISDVLPHARSWSMPAWQREFAALQGMGTTPAGSESSGYHNVLAVLHDFVPALRHLFHYYAFFSIAQNESSEQGVRTSIMFEAQAGRSRSRSRSAGKLRRGQSMKMGSWVARAEAADAPPPPPPPPPNDGGPADGVMRATVALGPTSSSAIVAAVHPGLAGVLGSTHNSSMSQMRASSGYAERMLARSKLRTASSSAAVMSADVRLAIVPTVPASDDKASPLATPKAFAGLTVGAADPASASGMRFDAFRRFVVDMGLQSIGRVSLPTRALSEVFLAAACGSGVPLRAATTGSTSSEDSFRPVVDPNASRMRLSFAQFVEVLGRIAMRAGTILDAKGQDLGPPPVWRIQALLQTLSNTLNRPGLVSLLDVRKDHCSVYPEQLMRGAVATHATFKTMWERDSKPDYVSMFASHVKRAALQAMQSLSEPASTLGPSDAPVGTSAGLTATEMARLFVEGGTASGLELATLAPAASADAAPPAPANHVYAYRATTDLRGARKPQCTMQPPQLAADVERQRAADDVRSEYATNGLPLPLMRTTVVLPAVSSSSSATVSAASPDLHAVESSLPAAGTVEAEVVPVTHPVAAVSSDGAVHDLLALEALWREQRKLRRIQDRLVLQRQADAVLEAESQPRKSAGLVQADGGASVVTATVREEIARRRELWAQMLNAREATAAAVQSAAAEQRAKRSVASAAHVTQSSTASVAGGDDASQAQFHATDVTTDATDGDMRIAQPQTSTFAPALSTSSPGDALSGARPSALSVRGSSAEHRLRSRTQSTGVADAYHSRLLTSPSQKGRAAETDRTPVTRADAFSPTEVEHGQDAPRAQRAATDGDGQSRSLRSASAESSTTAGTAGHARDGESAAQRGVKELESEVTAAGRTPTRASGSLASLGSDTQPNQGRNSVPSLPLSITSAAEASSVSNFSAAVAAAASGLETDSRLPASGSRGLTRTMSASTRMHASPDRVVITSRSVPSLSVAAAASTAATNSTTAPPATQAGSQPLASQRGLKFSPSLDAVREGSTAASRGTSPVHDDTTSDAHPGVDAALPKPVALATATSGGVATHAEGTDPQEAGMDRYRSNSHERQPNVARRPSGRSVVDASPRASMPSTTLTRSPTDDSMGVDGRKQRNSSSAVVKPAADAHDNARDRGLARDLAAEVAAAAALRGSQPRDDTSTAAVAGTDPKAKLGSREGISAPRLQSSDASSSSAVTTLTVVSPDAGKAAGTKLASNAGDKPPVANSAAGQDASSIGTAAPVQAPAPAAASQAGVKPGPAAAAPASATSPSIDSSASRTPGPDKLERELMERRIAFKRMLGLGLVATKFGRYGWPHKRLVTVDGEFRHIIWRAAESKATAPNKEAIPVTDILVVLEGATTAVFKRNTRYVKDPCCCLSVVTPLRTLDLECESQTQRDEWVKAFQCLQKYKAGI